MPFPQPKHDGLCEKHESVSFGVVRESQAIGRFGDKVTGAGDEIFWLGREPECPA